MTTELQLHPPVEPPAVMPTAYGPPPQRIRGRDLDGIVSLKVRDLFPDIPAAIYTGGQDVSAVRTSAEAILATVDMSKIQPTDTVNVLCSEHGFGMAGGWAYAEMLTVIKESIKQKTGCTNVRLVVIAWLGAKEADELIEYYELDKRYDGRVRGATPMDQGIAIETAIGTLYGLRKVYDGDWIVHAHYDDPREIYLHHAIDRITKPFGMSYARMETRSVFHMTMGPRSGNFIGRAIADSDFVRSKLAFTASLTTSPDGVVEVDADNSIDAIGNRMITNILHYYGKMLALFRSITDCVAVVDGGKWPYYIHSGGMIFGHLFYNNADWFDLDRPGEPLSIEDSLAVGMSQSIKAAVLNQTLVGLNYSSLMFMCPVIVANPEMEVALRHDFANPRLLGRSVVAPDLHAAVERAIDVGGSDKIIVFDGSYGALNVSEPMARHLMELAPACSREVDENLLPKWLKQRGINSTGVY